jgi:aminoglycoside 3-N-acetyltransferase
MALVTVEQLVEDLGALGVRRGSVVLAHTSLSRLGRVVGGEQAVIAALLQAIARPGRW